MTSENTRPPFASDLRRRAEEVDQRSAAQSPEDIASLSVEEIRQRLHELRVHQIELEMQNGQLQKAQVALEASQARYYDLYDMAPAGYCTISEQGLLMEANLKAANLLGMTRVELVGQRFSRFIFDEDQDVYYLLRKQLFASFAPQECDLRMVPVAGVTFWVHLSATLAKDESGKPVSWMVLSDITERKQAEENLKVANVVLAQKDALLRSILHNLPFDFWARDLRQNMLIQSKESVRIWGDLTGTELHEANVDPEYLAVWKATNARVLTGEVVSNEQAYTVLGEPRQFHAIVAPILLAEEVQGILGINIDITERKRAEESLREQRDFSESLIETAQVIILVLDTQGRIVRFNPYMEQLAGYALDEVKGLDWFETFLTPEIDLTIKPLFQKTVADIHTSGNVNPIIAKDGRAIFVEWYNKTLKDKEGRTMGVLAIGQDITEREQAQSNLKMAHEKLLAILDSIDSTLYVADMDTYEILFMNKRMITDFGGNKTGDLCYRAFRKNSAPCEYCTNDKLINEAGNPAGVCVWHDHNPVTGRYYTNHDRAIEWTDGHLVRMQIATDITDLKNMEAQLHQAQKMESVGRLAGGVAHDFNNMLSVILGHTEMALDDVDPAAPLHASLQAINYAAERSATLTRQLLAFARKQTIAPKVIDINETVAGMLNMLRRLIGEDIDLLWQPGRNLKPIKVDPSQIDQLLANLCVNARDAIDGVGKITIETDRKTFDAAYCADHNGFLPGEYLLLEVSDDGCGMDQAVLNQIFEPFFTTKEQGKGTGLGLASVFGMVKQNNGFINVVSESGQGTTFEIYLPIFIVSSGIVAAEAPGPPAERGNETILLVEDEPAILRMATRMLTRLGYTVVAAATPGEAIRLALEYRGKIDLLMTDVVMPEMNGRELAGNLLSHFPDLKRLFMSGYTADIIAHHGVLDEGVHFIQKPFSMKDLGGKLRETLDG